MENITTVGGRQMTIIKDGLSPLSNEYLSLILKNFKPFNCVIQLYEFEKAGK
jgi:hypothetical protein